MFTQLDVFRVAHEMARHAGTRQAVVARNMANADTPGYKSQDIPDFQSVIGARGDGGGLRATRARHLHGADSSIERGLIPSEAEAKTGDPNGNSVSLEHEMLKSVEVKRQHDRAIAIYKSSLTLMRTTLGRR